MASQERSLRNSVCLNHPDRPAAQRCTVCFKPICEQCAISSGEGTFCSQTCSDNYQRTRAGVGAWHDQRQREASRRRRRTVVRLVILLILAIAAYLYLTRNPAGLDKAKEGAGKALEGVKRTVGR